MRVLIAMTGLMLVRVTLLVRMAMTILGYLALRAAGRSEGNDAKGCEKREAGRGSAFHGCLQICSTDDWRNGYSAGYGTALFSAAGPCRAWRAPKRA